MLVVIGRPWGFCNALGCLAPERRERSPVLTWLSLARLLPSRASLRFTKQGPVYYSV